MGRVASASSSVQATGDGRTAAFCTGAGSATDAPKRRAARSARLPGRTRQRRPHRQRLKPTRRPSARSPTRSDRGPPRTHQRPFLRSDLIIWSTQWMDVGRRRLAGWSMHDVDDAASSDALTADIRQRYSITSSARASSAGGTVRPSALAVLRLITSSNLVGCSTGRSEGLVPLRILST